MKPTNPVADALAERANALVDAMDTGQPTLELALEVRELCRVYSKRARPRGQRVRPLTGGKRIVIPAGTTWRDHPLYDPRRLGCYACGRMKRHMAGAYCVTCSARGNDFGWCGCGAALYRDGCGSPERHMGRVS